MLRAPRHYELALPVAAQPPAVFAFADDHASFSSHMNKPSWMMGGGRMEVVLDEGRGQRVGSHIRLQGRVFGLPLSLDEVVTRHEPPRVKTWETVGTPQLLVVGNYRMGIEIAPQGSGSTLRVFIDYDLPAKNAWLGRLFGGMYAQWCVRQMSNDVRDHFITT
ncbi:MAG: SRPBCC family protein [bacterium]|nr:SRPBCC family protein [bacterium]